MSCGKLFTIPIGAPIESEPRRPTDSARCIRREAGRRLRGLPTRVCRQHVCLADTDGELLISVRVASNGGSALARSRRSPPIERNSFPKDFYMSMNKDQIERDENSTLISADKVEGTKVMNPTGEKLGSIEDIMIDKRSGKVAYAVMSFGGFLGIGDKHHPLPWSMLKYDTNLNGYVVNLDKRTLENAPTYGTDEHIDLADETYGRKVHDYYKVPPYWL